MSLESIFDKPLGESNMEKQVYYQITKVDEEGGKNLVGTN